MLVDVWGLQLVVPTLISKNETQHPRAWDTGLNSVPWLQTLANASFLSHLADEEGKQRPELALVLYWCYCGIASNDVSHMTNFTVEMMSKQFALDAGGDFLRYRPNSFLRLICKEGVQEKLVSGVGLVWLLWAIMPLRCSKLLFKVCLNGCLGYFFCFSTSLGQPAQASRLSQIWGVFKTIWH